MKKALLAFVMMWGLMAFAQRGDGHKGRLAHWKDMTPEQIATLQTKKMTLALDLSESQQREIQKINLENATDRKAKMAEWKAKKESGEMTKPATEEQYAKKIALLDRQIAHKEKMKQLLSKEQYEKWADMHSKKTMHHKREGRMKEGRRK